LNDFDGANPLLDPLEGVGPEISTSLSHANGTRLALRAQKSFDFQDPPLPMVFQTDLPASKTLRTAPYKKQVYINS
jgi:hypothetical protein